MKTGEVGAVSREPELVGNILLRRLAELRDGIKVDVPRNAGSEGVSARHIEAKAHIQALMEFLDVAAYTTGMGDILLVTRQHRKPMAKEEWALYERFELNKDEADFFDLFGLKRWPE